MNGNYGKYVRTKDFLGYSLEFLNLFYHNSFQIALEFASKGC